MPSQVSDDVLSRAVFQSITEGTYPDDEKIVSSELTSQAVDSLSKLLEEAREEVKASIQELSRLSAPDIDGWISQARQLKDDIDSSETQAAEIVTLAEKSKELDAEAKDAEEKVFLLQKEVAFNDTLFTTLEQVQGVKQTVDAAQEAVIAGNLTEGAKLLQNSREQLSHLDGCSNTRLTGLLQDKLADLEATLAESATKQWKALVHTNYDQGHITIMRELEGASLETAASVLDGLDLLKAKIIGLKKDLESAVLFPRLRVLSGGQTLSLSISETKLGVSEQKSVLSTESLFADFESMMDFLESALPKSVVGPLSELLVPSLVSRLVTGPLSSCVPPDLSGLVGFESTLSHVNSFAQTLDARGWPGSSGLSRWASDAPKVWLAQRSDTSLHSVRQLLLRGLGEPRSVERVETQKVAQDDEVFQGQGNADDWDASWSDNEGASKLPTTAVPKEKPGEADDNDGDAWGWDDNENEEPGEGDSSKRVDSAPSDDEDETDAWGWGEDEEQKQASSSATKKSPNHAPSEGQSNGKPTNKKPTEREITLRESYFITALPEQILEIVVQVVDDADSLMRASHTSNPIKPASAELLQLPNLLLSMYRASAPTFYTHDINGNMYIYNDSLYLAEQLRLFAEHHDSRSTGNDFSTTGLDSEIAALELFGKGAYRKEMESQRTILGDLLDIAQEFNNCTEYPYSEQCHNAISSTIDRLREVHRQFKQVLSPSALLQSTGSLLTTITNKIIVDIEDMSDISEPESQRLASYCRRIAEVEDLFAPDKAEGAEGSQSAVAAAVYTPVWWKFQYLAEILESSLADIKYLWTEGELSLEFETGEVVDLIEALFADSDYRRKAIAEIKRHARR